MIQVMEETSSEQPNNSKVPEQLKDHAWKKGQSGNPGGRPKGTMKNYLGRKFQEMSDEDKEAFVKEHKLSGKDQIEFGEGKPKQDIDIEANISGPSYIRLDE